MPWSLFEILSSLPTFALVLFRLGGLMATAPIFASSIVPIRVRIGLAMTLSAMIFPFVKQQVPSEISLVSVLVSGTGEVLVGLSIGLAITIILTCADITGQMVAQQAGIALGQVFDPSRQDRTTVVGQIYGLTLLTMFLVAGGHRATLAALLDTYAVIPVLSYNYDESVVLLLIEMLTAALILGIRLAAPVLIALFLASVMLGFLSRTMPQMNILSVGFTLRVMIALGTAGLALASCHELLLDGIWAGFEDIRSSFGLDVSRMRLVN